MNLGNQTFYSERMKLSLFFLVATEAANNGMIKISSRNWSVATHRQNIRVQDRNKLTSKRPLYMGRKVNLAVKMSILVFSGSLYMERAVPQSWGVSIEIQAEFIFPSKNQTPCWHFHVRNDFWKKLSSSKVLNTNNIAEKACENWSCTLVPALEVVKDIWSTV